ncbi:MAG: hypothetical protein ABI977_19095 [Acidobacteriota bacterium]
MYQARDSWHVLREIFKRLIEVRTDPNNGVAKPNLAAFALGRLIIGVAINMTVDRSQFERRLFFIGDYDFFAWLKIIEQGLRLRC